MENNSESKEKRLEGLTQNERRMATEKMPKLIFFNALPTVIGMFVAALYNIVDRYWVGKMPEVGSAALTGLGLTLPITAIMLGVAQLVGIGATTCISISLGKKNKEDAEKLLGNALVFVCFTSALLTGLGLTFLEDILLLVGANEETMPYAYPYARILIMGCFFQQLSFAMNHPIRATGNAKRFASTQMLGAVINMILDPIFIFVFDMGLEGVALATLIAQACSATWVMSFHLGKKSILKIRKKNLVPDLKIAKRVFSIGFSAFFMQIAASLNTVVLNKQLLHYGEIEYGSGVAAVGAMTVIASITMFFFMPVIGINQGMTPIIGFNYGAKDYVRVKSALQWGVTYAAIICTIGFITIQLFSYQLVSLFNNDPDLVAIGAHGMRIFLAAFILAGIQAPCSMFFQATGNALSAIFLSLLRQVILLLPLFLILPLFFGLTGIWMAGLVADILATSITIFLVLRKLKKLNAKI